MSSEPRVRPIVVRPGARYQCFGDGLCCTDIHILGPLSKREAKRVAQVDPSGLTYDDDGDEEQPVLRVATDGGCHFLLPDRRCGIHASHGPMQKPDFCRRFPVGLVATPQGGRVTTEHRCPCRTLGDRPLLDEDNVMSSIVDRQGRPKAERRVKRVALTKKTKVSFDEWRAVEADLLGRLASGEDARNVLGVRPFPELKKSDWATELDAIAAECLDGSSFGFAALWFVEHGRRRLDREHRLRLPVRPWAAAFDRALARDGEPRTDVDVFSDWIADEIWSLKWTDDRTFDVVCVELATRLSIARAVARTLRADHACRPDRAAAEAIMVVELVGESTYWSDIVAKIRV
ncbi:MAG: YkgJ family cysteine cluster protein [Myxococcales bacterium]|nr:YkgJ family cysteine cluster protein [Myxococcales bacterium]